ncbi:MAG: ATP-binding protein [Thermodesulfobacteriota bacterium]
MTSLAYILSVAVGAFFLAASIILSFSRNKTIPRDLAGRWRLMTCLMLFFLAGYCGYLYLQLSGHPFPLELLTSLIFLGGAVFVYLVIGLSMETIRRINEANEVLEERVRERTGQLAASNEKLGEELEQRKAIEKRLQTSHAELEEGHRQLAEAHAQLQAAQSRMLQREKMASVGQLAAGVAHEINNPVGFVASNLTTLAKYIDRLTEYIELLQQEASSVAREKLQSARKELKIDYISEDARDLIRESLDGTDRVSAIVRGLKSFSRVDEARQQAADINECLEATLNIVWNELKYKASVTKEYGDLPRTVCNPQQLNQVFMNFLVNAAQAIDKQGEIRISTSQADNMILVSIADSGCGIAPENLSRIFEPFFTTKEIGKGTGLGLSISYDIIKQHGGEITVASEPGCGTTFTVKIPVVAA